MCLISDKSYVLGKINNGTHKQEKLFQMKPARFTILISIFISTSLYVSGNYVPIIRRTYCYLCDTGILRSVWVAVWSPSRPDSHPYRVQKYQCHIDTVSYPDDGHIVARNM